MKLQILILYALFIFPNIAFGEACETITLRKDKTILVTATVEGPRGVLNFPAIIDTGATNSFIPRSIADGISYKEQIKSTYTTAAGDKSFDTITVTKLSFLGAEFHNVKVAITDNSRNSKPSEFLKSLMTPQDLARLKNKKEEEMAVIGMTELSEIKFSYENNSFKVCQ